MRPEPPIHQAPTALLIFLWGVGGVLGVLVNAIARILPMALEPLRSGAMTPALWAAAALWIAWMAYTEGYRGFHRAFAPRVIVRALHLARAPRPALVVLAPLVAMGLIHATRKRKIVSWAIVLGVTAIVLVVRGVAQPWRGIIDGGVVIGLGWGLASVAWLFGRYLLGYSLPEAVDLPEDEPAPAPAPA